MRMIQLISAALILSEARRPASGFSAAPRNRIAGATIGASAPAPRRCCSRAASSSPKNRSLTSAASIAPSLSSTSARRLPRTELPTDSAPVNYVANIFKPGPNSGTADYLISASDSATLYVRGNITPTRLSNDADELIGVVRASEHKWITSTRHDAPMVSTTSAFDAYDRVLATAGAYASLTCEGAFEMRRDVVDARIVNEVVTETGEII